MSYDDYPQVGAGWHFPPRWKLPEGQPSGVAAPAAVAGCAGVEHVREAMIVLLRTQLGSRVMRPGVGAGVDRYVFEPPTAAVCNRHADEVRRALMLGEPRVIVDEVTATPAGDADDRVDVTIVFRIDRHRRPESLVLPFYVAGGS